MRYKTIFLFFSLGLLVGCRDAKNERVLENKSKISSLFVNLEGDEVHIKDFEGKRILINFWATWCTPCLQEMPSMVKAQEILNEENYVFLFPSTDKIEKIKVFSASKNYPLQFLHYTSTLDKMNIYALPATLIYDTKGKMVTRIDGATEWDSEETINLLKAVE